MGAEVTIVCADGQFTGYLATPKSGFGPGVIVIQEIFGVNKVMREITDQLASDGYTALCPDLFWRQQPGIQLTDETEENWKRAFELYQGFDINKGIGDIVSSIDHIRNISDNIEKVGCVGYCLGGFLAYLTSTSSVADCAVSYYGVGIEERLDEANNINGKLLLHIAEEDKFVSKQDQLQIEDRLSTNNSVTIHTYAKVNHAFARVGGEHYDQTAAELANTRTSNFLSTNLVD